MKYHQSIIIALLFIAVVSSRTVDEKSEVEEHSVPKEDQQDSVRLPRDHGAGDRHRRKRYSFGHSYLPPQPPFYFDRRDDRNQQELLEQIMTLLDELSAYVRRPPPPPQFPQPIYIPYPVPYPVPQYQCKCPSYCSQSNKTELFPDTPNRFPVMEDTNQNWGFTDSEEPTGGGDGTRPISFDQIPPIQTMKRPQPSVEHGSSQAGSDADVTTKNPFAARGLSFQSPSRCDAAVLSCCGSSDYSEQKKCFSNVGCDSYYSKGNACSSATVARVLDSFTKAYSVEN